MDFPVVVGQNIFQRTQPAIDCLLKYRSGALSVLALPPHAALGLRLVYETVDAIWYAAGDTATDFSFYTKRATLAGIYAATLLYWLEDRSPGFADTRAFLDRRLAEVARIGQARHRLQTALDRLPNPLRLLRASS